jgi:hypothetical protein
LTKELQTYNEIAEEFTDPLKTHSICKDRHLFLGKKIQDTINQNIDMTAINQNIVTTAINQNIDTTAINQNIDTTAQNKTGFYFILLNYILILFYFI